MARPRKQTDETALFVRIPAAEAAKLHRAADALGAPKRELITRLVAQYVDPDDPTMLSALGGPRAEWAVGQHSFRPASEMEILTPAQLAGLLQVEEEVVVELAEKQELPGRKVGEEWRFSREAILAWLAEEE
jgi:excisionase family DNA binding protein